MKQRTGFTLIEMLVVVMIITMLAGLTLSAVGSARNAAAAARTRATIEKINRVVMKHYASYQYRKVNIDITSDMSKKDVAREKLNALRVLIRQEMPDRKSDVTSLKYKNKTKPAITQMFSSKCDTGTEEYMAAELLYMQVMADPVGAGMFSEGEIGDYDQDGLPEFLDGWGRPIRYILWPAGFFGNNNCESDLQVTTVTNNAKFVHDPFDTANIEPGTPALYPLIFSAGPDGIYDIFIGKKENTTLSYENDSPDPMMLCPRPDNSGSKINIAHPWNDTDGNNNVLHHYDNITNHSMLTNSN